MHNKRYIRYIFGSCGQYNIFTSITNLLLDTTSLSPHKHIKDAFISETLTSKMRKLPKDL